MNEIKDVDSKQMIGPFGPTSGGRAPHLSAELRRRLATLRKGRTLLIPDDPTQPSSGRGFLHDTQMLVHSFARRKNLPKFSTWKTTDPETGEKVLAIQLRETKK